MQIDLIITAQIIIFVSTLIRGIFGFGNALIAMPLLAMLIGIRTTTPLIALISSFMALIILARDWRKVQIKSARQLIISSLPGIPLGLLLLKGVHEDAVKIILAVIIIGFSIYDLVSPRLTISGRFRFAFISGFMAGILGGAYNTNGPPIVIYGTLRRWSPHNFRATLQGYFFPVSLLIIGGHGLAGLWTAEVFRLCIVSLPIVFVTILTGEKINRKIPRGKFDKYVHVLLIAIGGLLLFNTIS
jgi:uncharacterized membrane protein YfcA